MKIFTVPFALGEIKGNIPLTTNIASKPSKEKIIDQAFRFHSQGNISEAAKNYQYLINKGFKDHRVFSNYGSILKDLGNLKEAEAYTRKAIELNPDFANSHSNLGDILRVLGKLKEAESSLRKAIELNPDLAEAHQRLGGVLLMLGKPIEAELSTRKAIVINPDFAKAYNNLGGILSDRGDLKEAELSLRKAIELNPNLAVSYYNLGNIIKSEEATIYLKKAVELKPEDEKFILTLAHNLCNKKEYDLAIKYLSKYKSNACQSLHLGCLLSLDREKDFNEKFKELSEKKACNADIGGIVEHANIIYEANYNSPFCNQAINYVHWDKINEESFSNEYLNQLIDYLKNSKHEKRSQGLLTQGIQTSGNLFSLNFPFIVSIKKALELKIEIYKNKFKDSGQGLITNWPEKYELRAWMISMKSGGFLKQHNHEYGWITGSFYLQIPKYHNNNDSGNIAFSYQGPRYPNKDKNFNLTIKKIETRDICIFPSSLFHHTIPFESSKERICFVFDLIQK